MEQVSYIEAPCRSAMNAVKGMPFKWSINPYRGCRHRCVYCFARQYQAWHELDAGLDFENKIFVKVNLPEVLREELRKPGWKRELVVVGTATDCYQPAEGHYRLTRRTLEALRDHYNPTEIITKGTMILRDVDILAEIARRAECSVNISLTTVDEDLWKKLEPGTPRPLKRLEVMRELVRAGVNAGVLMAPCVPGITTQPGVIERVLEAAAKYEARYACHSPLRLAPGTREWYLGFVKREYPQLYEGYLRLYSRGAHASKDYVNRLATRVAEARAEYKVGQGQRRPAPKPLQPELLSE
ncbi:MAG TPA: radical SAM protein [Chloroflexota bacterium]|nr:radical SAM protein [Chloroflexota bacterium]